jgi:hypothetical protein
VDLVTCYQKINQEFEWGKIPRRPALLTEFKMEVERLGLARTSMRHRLSSDDGASGTKIASNVPEWLLVEWGMSAEASFSGIP